MNKLRGHKIVFKNGEWLYADTMTPTVNNQRNCGECGKANTLDGHDGCLGGLPNVMNACCGHGDIKDAYVQYMDGSCDTGYKAFEEFINLKQEVKWLT